MKICTVEGCNVEAKSKGMCVKHYSAHHYATNKEKYKKRNDAWNAANKDKRREFDRNWRTNNPEKSKQIDAKYKASHKEELVKRAQSYQARHPGKQKAYDAKRYALNPDKERARTAAWSKANPEKACAQVARRNARKLNATPAWANEFFIEEIYDLAQRRTKATGFKWHVDHVVPLQSKLVCGLHVEHNLQVIPATVNLRKHNSHWPDMP